VMWKNRAMTGPSRAIQITAAATSDRADVAERRAGARTAPDAWPGSGAGLTAQLTRCYPVISAFTAAGTALASPVIVGVSRLYPSLAYSARPAGDSA